MDNGSLMRLTATTYPFWHHVRGRHWLNVSWRQRALVRFSAREVAQVHFVSSFSIRKPNAVVNLGWSIFAVKVGQNSTTLLTTSFFLAILLFNECEGRRSISRLDYGDMYELESCNQMLSFALFVETSFNTSAYFEKIVLSLRKHEDGSAW
jgi:hypothetical protein